MKPIELEPQSPHIKADRRLVFQVLTAYGNVVLDGYASEVMEDYGERRWRTIGIVGGVVLIVIHTWMENDSSKGHAIGRIISARKAERHERKAYEEGHY